MRLDAVRYADPVVPGNTIEARVGAAGNADYISLNDGLVVIEWHDGGRVGIPLGRCFEVVLTKPEPLPTGPDRELLPPRDPGKPQRSHGFFPWQRR